MSRAADDARSRSWAGLVALLGAVLAILLPSLIATGSDAAGAATLAVLVLASAALVRFGSRCLALTGRGRTAPVPTGHEAPAVLAGRVTDPVHHPLRPRAPGPA